MIRLALSEDHTIVRWALREALNKAEDIEVVGEAGTAEETLKMIQEVHPDVLLLDITLPDRSGFDVLSDLRSIETAPLVVVLTWHTEPSYTARAIAAGAHGYVNKSVEPQELLDAIRAVSRGEQVIPPGVEALLDNGEAPGERPDGARTTGDGDARARHDQPRDRRTPARSASRPSIPIAVTC